MQITLAKIVLSITNNGTPKAFIWDKGSDLNSYSEAKEIIGNEVIYLATREIGETIELSTRNKWINVVVPQEYQNALNNPAYNRTKLLFQRAMHGIDLAMNGARTDIDLETAKVLVSDNVEAFLKLQDTVKETIDNLNTKYTKEIQKNYKLPISEQTLSPYSEINKLTLSAIANIGKDYKICNDGIQPKEDRKNSKI